MTADTATLQRAPDDRHRAIDSDGPPEIRVNGVTIEPAAIEREAQNHPSATLNQALAAAARALVVRELLLQEASRLQLAPLPQADDTESAMGEEDALIDALLEQEVRTPLADEAACRRYFMNNPAKFRAPDLYEARHILIPAKAEDPVGRTAAKALAERLIAVLQDDPTCFADLARAHSACPSREQGGNLGQISQGQTVPEFETFLFNLKEGQLCPVPAPTPFGFHVVQLERKIVGRPLDFDIVQPRIAAYLEAASWSRAMAQYVSLLASDARIEGIEMGGADSPLVQ